MDTDTVSIVSKCYRLCSLPVVSSSDTGCAVFVSMWIQMYPCIRGVSTSIPVPLGPVRAALGADDNLADSACVLILRPRHHSTTQNFVIFWNNGAKSPKNPPRTHPLDRSHEQGFEALKHHHMQYEARRASTEARRPGRMGSAGRALDVNPLSLKTVVCRTTTLIGIHAISICHCNSKSLESL